MKRYLSFFFLIQAVFLASFSDATQKFSSSTLPMSIFATESSSLLLRHLVTELPQADKTKIELFTYQGEQSTFAALLEGRATLISTESSLSNEQKRLFQTHYGYPVTELIMGYDAFLIVTSPELQIDSLTIAQLDAIFSSTRYCGSSFSISDWQDLLPPLERSFQLDMSIRTVGRKNNSDSYQQFRALALCGGDVSPKVSALINNQQIAQLIANSKQMIGYINSTNMRADLNLLAIEKGEEKIFPTVESIQNGRYPLRKTLYFYANMNAQLEGQQTPLQQFLQFVDSPEGEAILIKQGFVPVESSKRVYEIEELNRILQ